MTRWQHWYGMLSNNVARHTVHHSRTIKAEWCTVCLTVSLLELGIHPVSSPNVLLAYSWSFEEYRSTIYLAPTNSSHSGIRCHRCTVSNGPKSSVRHSAVTALFIFGCHCHGVAFGRAHAESTLLWSNLYAPRCWHISPIPRWAASGETIGWKPINPSTDVHQLHVYRDRRCVLCQWFRPPTRYLLKTSNHVGFGVTRKKSYS